ncbi:DUF6612 family protein [Cohnella panacarvi]|uniref:DUF6612 family protein n=1 Tax=Cohnella panacarvi TaxID=400776 RepID=UPI00047ADCA0|nr:DUF6612 family protein [Cohnella panacarvi]
MNLLRAGVRRAAGIGTIFFMLAACGAGKEADNTPAAAALAEGQSAAVQMKKYAFEMQMDQKLSGTPDTTADVKVDMQGLVEREPLKLDQTIHTTIDGETSVVRAVIVPEGYYMYSPEYEEWSKLSTETAGENTATLSDYQVDPGNAVQAIGGLSEFAKLEGGNRTQVVRYEGAGTEANVYAIKLLESTMGLSAMDERMQKSLKVNKLRVELTLDAEQRWPLSYAIDSDLSLELEAGKPTTVQTMLSGSYSDVNQSRSVALPDEAKGALSPEEIDERLGDDPLNLNEGE